MLHARMVCLALVAVLNACASAATGSGPGTAGAATAPAASSPGSRSTDRDVISRGQLAAQPSSNLYDAVTSLRSHWLRGPVAARSSMSISSRDTSARGGGISQPAISVGASGTATTEVYIDGRRFGALASLRSMSAESAEKLCYFTLNRAQGRFGLSVQAPVIEVFTRGSSYSQTSC